VIRCRIFGCYMEHHQAQCCERCGAWYLDPEFVGCSIAHRGRVALSRWWSYLKYRCPVRRCPECSRLYWGESLCCSEECDRKYVPF